MVNSNLALNSNSRGIKKSKNLKILYTVVITIVLLIMLYIMVFGIKYLLTDCYEKTTFWSYLKSGSFSNVCVYKYKPASYKERKKEDEKEVFHIGNQDYTYDQAKCKCAAYNSDLATKTNIIRAYNNGANWCTYGWSEGQNAYFPVQKCVWDKKQSHKSTKNTCGHKPGINGGYFANPVLKFGANCWGIKPKGSVAIQKKPYCAPKNVCSLRKNKFSSDKLDTDEITPFNDDQWSKYIN